MALGLGYMFPFSPLGNLNWPTQIQDVQTRKAVAFHLTDLKMQGKGQKYSCNLHGKSQRIFTSLLGKHPFLQFRKGPFPLFHGDRKESDGSNEE